MSLCYAPSINEVYFGPSTVPVVQSVDIQLKKSYEPIIQIESVAESRLKSSSWPEHSQTDRRCVEPATTQCCPANHIAVELGQHHSRRRTLRSCRAQWTWREHDNIATHSHNSIAWSLTRSRTLGLGLGLETTVLHSHNLISWSLTRSRNDRPTGLHQALLTDRQDSTRDYWQTYRTQPGITDRPTGQGLHQALLPT